MDFRLRRYISKPIRDANNPHPTGDDSIQTEEADFVLQEDDVSFVLLEDAA